MRIAVDARVLGYAELRGIGSYLCELLAAWPRSDDCFVLISQTPIPAQRLRSPSRLETIVAPAVAGYRLRLWDWLVMPRVVRNTGADLFWGPANQAFPLSDMPQATTVHDTLLQERVRHASLADRLFHKRVSPWWVRHRARRVITVSRFSKSRIETVFGCAPCRVRVIANGATLPVRPFPNKASAFAHVHARGLVRHPYALTLGAESPWKNTEGAIRAFALAAKENTELDFLIAGVQERAMAGFEALGRGLGLGERLRLLPFVDRLDRDALYQGARVFVYPSLFEGFGLPPLEAMALETPVVASCAASIPEVVGQAARLVDATDLSSLACGILAVLQSSELAERLVAAGRDNIRRFAWDRSAWEHRQLFSECLT
jgi:glycosyltransferase involved in cell wall biosynthesis